MSTTPKIYVACLASYNNGILYGKWIDANQTAEDIHAEVMTMLAASPEIGAEEWAIHDYEGFSSIKLSEWEGFEQVSALAEFIEEHDELGAALLEHFQGDIEQARTALEDDYRGEYQSLADFAEEITTETVTILESLRYYIDYKAMARDMEINGDVFTVEIGYNQVHVFWNR